MFKVFPIYHFNFSAEVSKVVAKLAQKPTPKGCLSTCMHVRSVVSDSLRPMVSSPPGSSVRGILQARILEWVAIPFSRGSS